MKLIIIFQKTINRLTKGVNKNTEKKKRLGKRETGKVKETKERDGKRGTHPHPKIYIICVQCTERKTKRRKPEKTNLIPKQKNQHQQNTCKHLKQGKRYFLLYIYIYCLYLYHTHKQINRRVKFCSFFLSVTIFSLFLLYICYQFLFLLCLPHRP